MDTLSGIGVLDKAVSVLDAVEAGPRTLAGLVEATGLSRATAHRLALALEVHGLLARDAAGRFVLGPRLTGLDLPALARPALEALRDATGESAQLYVRRGDRRLCVLSLESPHGLRTIVPVGMSLPLDVGSAGKVLRGDAGDVGPERRGAGAGRGVGERPGARRHGARRWPQSRCRAPSSAPPGSPGRLYAGAVCEAAAKVSAALQRQTSSG